MSNAFSSFVESRVDGNRATLGVAVGDLLLIGLFVLLGELRHGVDPVTQPLVVLDTYAPFLVGWLVAALAVGAYGPRARRSMESAVTATAGAWVVAVLVAQLLRASAFFHGDADPAFAAVSLLVGLALLLPWRAALARR